MSHDIKSPCDWTLVLGRVWGI